MSSLSSLLENKTVGVFFGGQNPEHDVSIITGSFILAELKKNGVNALGIYIGIDGTFYCDEKVNSLNFFKGEYINELDSLQKYNLNLSKSKGKLVFEHKTLFGKKSLSIDFAFPAFHGINGEDGSIQGLFEFFGIPYAGCGIFSSSLAINKAKAKEMFIGQNINTTIFVATTENSFSSDEKELINAVNTDLTYPVFVKPTKAGSSIGITKVDGKDDLKEAIELAFSYDDEVLIENGVPNIRDLTCCILNDGKKSIASEVQEAMFEDGFLSYDDKYMKDGGTQLGGVDSPIVIPAKITDEQKKEIQELSLQIFEAMDANGIARIDFLLNEKTGEIFANEINTLPGTLYHHLWEKSGIEIAKVLEKMISAGLQRDTSKKKSDIQFTSNILNDANSMKLQYS